LCEFSGRSHKYTIFTTYYEDTVNNDTMCFQATVVALVCLTASCLVLTERYSQTIRFQLNSKIGDFEADEVVMSWMGKRRNLFYLHTHSGAIVLYCRAHWGMELIFHQAKPRWTRREEDSKSSVLDLDLVMRS